MPDLYAAEPRRKPRMHLADCPACSTTYARCEAGFWLRSGYCCPGCDGHETRTTTDAA